MVVLKHLTIKLEGLRTPYAEAAYEVSTACIGSTLQLYGKGIGYFNWSGTMDLPARNSINHT
jgi:hypothetical protein